MVKVGNQRISSTERLNGQGLLVGGLELVGRVYMEVIISEVSFQAKSMP